MKCEQWATGNPCMSPLTELVQGLPRNCRISYIPAVVPCDIPNETLARAALV
jgi:hypothetical protein